MFESGKRYLVAQGVVRPPSVITLVALGLSPLYCWALIFKFGLGLDGAALSVVAIEATMVLLLLGYITVMTLRDHGKPHATWPGFSLDAFSGWGDYIR